MAPAEDSSNFGRFVAEMRRRHVVRFALGYAAAAFVVLQLAEIVLPAFGLGEGALRAVVVVTALGFPPALVLAWVYDITTDGIRRTSDSPGESAALPRLALLGLLASTLGVTGALGIYLADHGVFDAQETAPARSAGPIITASYDPSVPIRSIAVLPLDDFSEDGGQAYFASGMHEELIAKLSLAEDIRVVSRRSVMRYADTDLSMSEIGRELNVDAVIEGSVSRNEDHTRVTLRVVHAASESDIQTLQWDRAEIDDLLAFQTEVAHEVVHELESDHEEAIFTVAAEDVDPAAQDAYLKGRYEVQSGTEEGYRAALNLFEDAYRADPDFAPALAGMAGSRFLLGLSDPDASVADLEGARAEANSALAMDSTSVEVLEVVELIERNFPLVATDELAIPAPAAMDAGGEPRMHVVKMAGTDDSIVVNVSAFDTAWVASVTTLGQRIEERVRAQRSRVKEAMGGLELHEARELVAMSRQDEAVQLLGEELAADPTASPAWALLLRAEAERGDTEGVVEAAARWAESGAPVAPGDRDVDDLRTALDADPQAGFWVWQVDWLSARRSEGLDFSRTDLATAHAALGNDDEAFDDLYEALGAGEPAVLTVRNDPAWDNLRGDPRFRDLGRHLQTVRFLPMRRPRGPEPR
jgi:TolB-like protein